MPTPQRRSSRKRVASPNRATNRPRKGEWEARGSSRRNNKPMDITLPLVAVFVALVVGAALWYILPDFSQTKPVANKPQARPAPNEAVSVRTDEGTASVGPVTRAPAPAPAPARTLPEPGSVASLRQDDTAAAPGSQLPDARLSLAPQTTAVSEPTEPLGAAPPSLGGATATLDEPPPSTLDDVPVQIAKAQAVTPEPAAPAPVEAPKPVPAAPDPVVTELGQVARALPVNPDELTVPRVAAYQVALERLHFSCGFVDGDVGMRTKRMLRAFQESRGLPVTGELDAATRAAIGEPGEPFTTYTVTEKDMALIAPPPKLWKEKAQAKLMGYDDAWEMLAEKFHCTRDYIQQLNHDVKTVAVGTQVIGPKVFPTAPLPKAAAVRIVLAETSMEVVDANGRIVAFFPCSIAADKAKRPKGELKVKNVAPNPDYTFSPSLFPSVSQQEGITKKMVIPPGPNNPVGTAWIGLSLPGYGMHGTPDPEAISRTQSHGCFRLANWNADKMIKMVKIGMPVYVVPPAEAVANASNGAQ